jgi:hypothetical protein
VSYPPPPYADAVTGLPVTGDSITGTWWAYPQQAGLKLGAYAPGLVIVNAQNDVTLTFPNAGLLLGSYAPEARISFTAVIPTTPGLLLGAIAPQTHADFAAVLQQAGLLLGARAPALTIFSTITLSEAGLVLGMYAASFIGQTWLSDLHCIEDDLAVLACTERDLVLAGESTIDLDLVGCR